MILKFKQKLGKGFPPVDLCGYDGWEVFDGMIEYKMEFSIKDNGISDIICTLSSFRIHMDNEKLDDTKTIDSIDINIKDTWTQATDSLTNGLHISHIVLDIDTGYMDIWMK
tara:strand:+ start:172 stop:504 length:333 start_codon:yes stop_codon:yes gene_type:complete